MVVFKPCGLLSVNSLWNKFSIKSFLERRLKHSVYIINRIDKPVSGWVFVCDPKLKGFYKECWKYNKKFYILATKGNPKLGRYDLYMSKYANRTLVENNKGTNVFSEITSTDILSKISHETKQVNFIFLKIQTGFRHQIRALLSYLKAPIIGDGLYSRTNLNKNKLFLMNYLTIFKVGKSYYHLEKDKKWVMNCWEDSL